MFLSRLDSKLPVSNFVNPILSPEIEAKVRSGEAFYIPQHDNWAMDQYVLFLLAPTQEDMIQRIYDLGDLPYDDFTKAYYDRVRKRMFQAFENTKMSEYLLRHFPFTMRVQADFQNVDESVEHRFVWLRRLKPDRSMLVHWIPYSDSINIDFDWIANTRDSIAARVFSGDVVVRDETTLQQVKFQRWEGAYRMEGTWMNPDIFIGGPFRNITFVDRKSNLIFMVDFYVQAIAQRKKMYLDQLDVMAATFESKSYIETE